MWQPERLYHSKRVALRAASSPHSSCSSSSQASQLEADPSEVDRWAGRIETRQRACESGSYCSWTLTGLDWARLNYALQVHFLAMTGLICEPVDRSLQKSLACADAMQLTPQLSLLQSSARSLLRSWRALLLVARLIANRLSRICASLPSSRASDLTP